MLLNPLLKWALGGTLFLSIILGGALAVERRHSHKLADRVVELNAELKRISTAKNEQAKRTDGKLVETRIIYRDAGKVAERIEKAPVVPGCKTPPEIMGADL